MGLPTDTISYKRQGKRIEHGFCSGLDDFVTRGYEMSYVITKECINKKWKRNSIYLLYEDDKRQSEIYNTKEYAPVVCFKTRGDDGRGGFKNVIQKLLKEKKQFDDENKNCNEQVFTRDGPELDYTIKVSEPSSRDSEILNRRLAQLARYRRLLTSRRRCDSPVLIKLLKEIY